MAAVARLVGRCHVIDQANDEMVALVGEVEGIPLLEVALSPRLRPYVAAIREAWTTRRSVRLATNAGVLWALTIPNGVVVHFVGTARPRPRPGRALPRLRSLPL